MGYLVDLDARPALASVHSRRHRVERLVPASQVLFGFKKGDAEPSGVLAVNEHPYGLRTLQTLGWGCRTVESMIWRAALITSSICDTSPPSNRAIRGDLLNLLLRMTNAPETTRVPTRS